MHTLRRKGSLPPDELVAARDAYVVVDIRDGSEWSAGHVAGAVHASVSQLADAWDDPGAHLPVAVFADSDEDARAAVEILQARGRDAVIVRGGVDAWRSAGHSLVTNKGE